MKIIYIIKRNDLEILRSANKGQVEALVRRYGKSKGYYMVQKRVKEEQT